MSNRPIAEIFTARFHIGVEQKALGLSEDGASNSQPRTQRECETKKEVADSSLTTWSQESKEEIRFFI